MPSIEALFGNADGPGTPEQEKSLAFLGSQFLLLDRQLQDLQKAMNDLRGRRDQAMMEVLNALESAKLKSVKLASGQHLTSAVKWQFSLPPKSNPQEREAALKWLRRVGYRDIIEPTIHQQTLTAILRERNEEGKSISPLLKKVETRYLSVRRGDS